MPFGWLPVWLAMMAGLALMPSANALYYTYNGGTVSWPHAKPALLTNSSVVVSPTLVKPFQITTITRARGVITRNVLQLNPTLHRIRWTLASGTTTPRVLNGTYLLQAAGFGSTIRVRLTQGNPTGVVTFYIQPGALTATGNFHYGSRSAPITREHFAGVVSQ